MKTREQIREERRQLKETYGELFDVIAALLFRYDPIGINFDDNTDEYESEVGTILPRLQHCRSAEDVRGIIHEEFVRWFSDEIAGSPERYTKIASEIWDLWRRYPSIHNTEPSAQ